MLNSDTSNINTVNEAAICRFNTVSERDMDMLFVQAFLTDSDFKGLFLSQVYKCGYSIQSVELSKVDAQYGESDITIILEHDGKKAALLIEDKIDAIAMPNQHERYIKRGNKGIKKGEYDEYDVFIVCPEKYRENNHEAVLYEHHVSYEQCLRYFESRPDDISKFRAEQFRQALYKAKRSSNVELNEAANNFFRAYRKFQQLYYPTLDLRTKAESNGYWAQYATKSAYSYILHKIPTGTVDLTFNDKSGKIKEFEALSEWLRMNTDIKVVAVVTGKSVALRINVPVLNMQRPFESYSETDVNTCFGALMELMRIDDMIIRMQDALQ